MSALQFLVRISAMHAKSTVSDAGILDILNIKNQTINPSGYYPYG